jgi:hypothetical protein
MIPSIVSAEIWICTLADGSEVYTNHPKDYEACNPYEPKTEELLLLRSRPALTPIAEGLSRPVAPMGVEPEDLRRGEMPFEVFRMLSIGMTEAEVIARAGPPTSLSALPLAAGAGLIAPVSNALRYNYIGDWTVVVTFDLSGRVIKLERFRPRP